MNRRPIDVSRSGNYHIPPAQINRNFRKPFWLPAVSYYFLTVAIVLAVFFILWWFLQEPDGGTPWIPAGIASSLLLIAAVLLREIILRNSMNRYVAAKRRLDENLSRAARAASPGITKFTLEQNSAVLSQIERKSNAVRTLGQLPDAHFEVFELCEEYLKFTSEELNSVSAGSPRFGAIRRGRRRAKGFHKYHLLGWAAIESSIYTQEAQICDTINAKIENSEKALTVLNTALRFYPNDSRLLESVDVVKELITSAEISHRIEKAEGAVKENDYKAAIGNYKDALFYLARDEMKSRETETLAKKITSKVNRLRAKAEESIEKTHVSRADDGRCD